MRRDRLRSRRRSGGALATAVIAVVAIMAALVVGLGAAAVLSPTSGGLSVPEQPPVQADVPATAVPVSTVAHGAPAVAPAPRHKRKVHRARKHRVKRVAARPKKAKKKRLAAAVRTTTRSASTVPRNAATQVPVTATPQPVVRQPVVRRPVVRRTVQRRAPAPPAKQDFTFER